MKPSTQLLTTCFAMLALTTHAQEPPSFQDVVQPYIDQGRFAGAAGVVVTREGIVAFPMAGYADVATKKPIARDTLYWIASTSKPFQATAVMMLVDEGKVKLDDPVSKYLPKFRPKLAGKDPTHAPTVRMLLNHTSGIDPQFPTAHPIDDLPLAAVVDLIAAKPLRHEPGTAFFYSDGGVTVASRIVEVVTGQAFEAFLDARLLKPLGMKDTTYFPTKEQVARLATAYWIPPETKKLTPVPDSLAQPRPRAQLADRKTRFAPLGGLFSTGDDLAQFARMFLNNGTLGGKRYLSEASVAEMTRNQIPQEAAASVPQPPPGRDSPVTYGLGWGIGSTGAYFHPGMASTDIRITPGLGIATIFLPQHGGDATVLEIYQRLLDAHEQHLMAR